MVALTEFNTAPTDAAGAVVRPCLGVDRWVDTIVAGRPYPSVDAAVAVARTAADPFTPAELDAALSHHPRIGERAAGANAEAQLSRGEQAGLDTGADVQQRLLRGNVAYEEKFGHVFLIRAAGRSSAEILAELERRMDNDDAAEALETADQLRQIALLRLEGALTA